MHEIGITQKMFDMVIRHAERAGAKKVVKVDLVIGEMTGALSECFQFYFNLLSKGSIAEGALIGIRMVPAMVRCRNCKQTSKLQEQEIWECPHCDQRSMEIIAGRELMVKSIGVEVNEEANE